MFSGDSDMFMSHGYCYLWKPALIGLHVASDVLIGIAYAAISLTLLYMVRRRRSQMPFHWMFVAFGGFIIACGCTHFMEVVTVWFPLYWLSGWIKVVTAAASVTTAIVLPRLVPDALGMIDSSQLADQRLYELRALNEELEERVAARTRELEQANELLAEKAAIVNNSNDAIFSKSLEGIIGSWNPGAERMYGYTAAEIVGKHVSVLVPEDRREELADAMGRIQRGILVEWMETVRVRKDGRRIDAHLSISPVRDATGRVRGASTIARDITDHKRTELQLREKQKLESLGVIAGGIAHDFNNLLVGIMGNASLVLDNMPANERTRPFVERVVDASEKAAHLTRQLLAYAGKGRFLFERIDLSSLCRQIADLLRTTISRSVELRLDLAQDLPAIEGDPGQFQQLIMNLVLNAAEAIEQHTAGLVKVSTRVFEGGGSEPLTGYLGAPLQPRSYVMLEVSDNGCGMSEEVRAKIFDPFFSTKFTGRGLGLAATLGIVRGHRGAIRVESAPGRGSTFRILIPAAQATTAAPATPVGVAELRGTGTILVADDEELVRVMARAALERFGYTVIVAQNGQIAVDEFCKRPDGIDVVILDLTMPVVSGEEAFRRIRAVRADARIVVSSGYSEAETIRRFGSGPSVAFIQKPYTAIQLAGVIKKML